MRCISKRKSKKVKKQINISNSNNSIETKSSDIIFQTEKDKLELKVEISFFLDCPNDKIEELKEKLDNFGWWVLQEIKLDKAIKLIPGVIETGYDVKVNPINY